MLEFLRRVWVSCANTRNGIHLLQLKMSIFLLAAMVRVRKRFFFSFYLIEAMKMKTKSTISTKNLLEWNMQNSE